MDSSGMELKDAPVGTGVILTRPLRWFIRVTSVLIESRLLKEHSSDPTSYLSNTFVTRRGKFVGRRLYLPRTWISIEPLTCSKRSGNEYSPGNLLFHGTTLGTGMKIDRGWQLGTLECKYTGSLTPNPTTLFPYPCVRCCRWMPPLYLIGGGPWVKRRGTGKR